MRVWQGKEVGVLQRSVRGGVHTAAQTSVEKYFLPCFDVLVTVFRQLVFRQLFESLA